MHLTSLFDLLKNTVIIEDELPAQLRLKSLLQAHSSMINIVGVADTGKKAIALIEEKKPALIFLDIQLPDMTGFDVLSKISYQPWIIFTTAYSEYALKAFENLSIDYLMKPIEQDRFDLAIQKLSKWEKPKELEFGLMQELISKIKKPKEAISLTIKKKDKILLVNFEQISHFKSEDKYVNVHLKNGEEHLLSKTLTQLEHSLPSTFVRVHRSYIVNKSIVTEIQKYFKGKYILQLQDSKLNKITTGQTYTDIIKETFTL